MKNDEIKLVIALHAIWEYMWEFWILNCCNPFLASKAQKISSEVYLSCNGW
jgi:hypothetical protein